MEQDSRIVRGRHSTEKVELSKQFRSNMTPTEALLWECLRAGRLNGIKFRRQQIVFGFIADFYCHAAQLIIEVDGDIHEHQQEYDAERTRVFEQHDLKVLRASTHDVEQNIESVLQQILTQISPTNPPPKAPNS